MFNLDVKWQPRDDRVLVLPLLAANPSLDGVIVLPGDTNRERPIHGVVVATGPGGIGPETGREIPVKAKPGELVAFGRYAGLEFEVSGPKGQTKMLILRDCEILLARSEGEYELITHEDNPAKMHEKGYVCEICQPPTVNLEALQAAAYGGDDVAKDEEKAPEVDVEAERMARENLAAERRRLMELRNPDPVTQG